MFFYIKAVYNIVPPSFFSIGHKMIDQTKETYAFEIVVAQRDSKGQPTGKKLNYSSDSSYKIWEFYHRNVTARLPRKKGGATTDNDAQQILKEMYGD
jgi:hypothetical protein